MKKLFVLLFTVASILCSCGEPNISGVKKAAPIQEDTLSAPTIEVSKNIVSPISIIISDSTVEVESFGLKTIYNTDVTTLTVTRDEQGNIQQLKVNGVTLFEPKNVVNHNYTYLEDNVLIVRPGNTISQIVEDHRKAGFDISRKSLFKCNPGLETKGLQVGQYLQLTCQ